MIDYYSVLGVPSDADEDTIKRKYRVLAKECHPDLNPGDKAAEAKFKEIGEAWEILSDPDKRSEYDRKRTNKKNAPAGKSSAPVGSVDYSNLMSRFDSFFGKDVVSPSSAKKQNNPLDASDLFNKYMGVGKK